MINTSCELELIKYVNANSINGSIKFETSELNVFKEGDVIEAAEKLSSLGLWELKIDITLNLKAELQLSNISNEAVQKFLNK